MTEKWFLFETQCNCCLTSSLSVLLVYCKPYEVVTQILIHSLTYLPVWSDRQMDLSYENIYRVNTMRRVVKKTSSQNKFMFFHYYLDTKRPVTKLDKTERQQTG